jgi:hypothetical protein
MFRPLELYIGLRYVRARRASRFVSFISLVSLLGVATGVAALIVVLSVMNGFEQELRARLLNLTSHAVVTAPGGGLLDWEPVLTQIEATPGVAGAAPFVEVQAMLAHEGLLKGTVLRGVDPAREASVSRIERHLLAGSLQALEPGADRLVLGRLLAARLRVGLGDPLTLLVPTGGETGARWCRACAASWSRDCSRSAWKNRTACWPSPIIEDAAAARGRPGEVSGGARRDGGPVRGAAHRARSGGRARSGLRGARLDFRERQLLPGGAHREDHDDAHPFAGGRGRGLQYRRHPGDGGDRQAHRNRDPAHHGPAPASIMRVFLVQGTRSVPPARCSACARVSCSP